jgi:hypothetical protein
MEEIIVLEAYIKKAWGSVNGIECGYDEKEMVYYVQSASPALRAVGGTRVQTVVNWLIAEREMHKVSKTSQIPMCCVCKEPIKKIAKRVNVVFCKSCLDAIEKEEMTC